jgi:hypothetical protein
MTEVKAFPKNAFRDQEQKLKIKKLLDTDFVLTLNVSKQFAEVCQMIGG